MRELIIEPAESSRLANLCGHLDENLHQIEQSLDVTIHSRGDRFQIRGEESSTRIAEEVLTGLYRDTSDNTLSPRQVHLYLQKIMAQHAQHHPDSSDLNCGEDNTEQDTVDDEDMLLRTRSASLKTNNPHQALYLKNIAKYAINFAVGPAGTGKTFLAVAAAVRALERDEVSRLILVRPAVEAGERLGFLPGDLSQKIDPYLRPLYDALYYFMGNDAVNKAIERGIIEVLPLAYMRGRTLNDSFIILDEAQNATTAQMKMFLTRIGFGSTAVITGDITQVDLPKSSTSGLMHVLKVLKGVRGIGFSYFNAADVVRHPLVQKIIEAYDLWEGRER
ncbi:MAG: PhoH family protein [Gammaproteobacteria bacterium]|nr:MAG: PhoH family protein [Gammaproteobacteria bacterium]